MTRQRSVAVSHVTLALVFACPAPAEPIGDSAMMLIRHRDCCPLLAERIRSRWPLTRSRLPDSPAPVAFAQRAGSSSRWRTAS
jgi:hypothetical protein